MAASANEEGECLLGRGLHGEALELKGLGVSPSEVGLDSACKGAQAGGLVVEAEGLECTRVAAEDGEGVEGGGRVADTVEEGGDEAPAEEGLLQEDSTWGSAELSQGKQLRGRNGAAK